jgi:hypothetical protein
VRIGTYSTVLCREAQLQIDMKMSFLESALCGQSQTRFAAAVVSHAGCVPLGPAGLARAPVPGDPGYFPPGLLGRLDRDGAGAAMPGAQMPEAAGAAKRPRQVEPSSAAAAASKALSLRAGVQFVKGAHPFCLYHDLAVPSSCVGRLFSVVGCLLSYHA